MAAISTSLKTGAANHNLGLFTKGHGGLADRHHHYSGPSGYYHHYDHHHSWVYKFFLNAILTPYSIFVFSGGKSKHKRSIAISALTLLAFLFFLNILQNCTLESINPTTPTIIVVTTPPPAAALISRYREADESEFANVSRSDKNAPEDALRRDKITNAHSNKKFRGK